MGGWFLFITHSGYLAEVAGAAPPGAAGGGRRGAAAHAETLGDVLPGAHPDRAEPDAILGGERHDAVGDLEHGAVATAGDEEVAACLDGFPGQVFAVPAMGGEHHVGFEARPFDRVHQRADAAPGAAPARHGVHDEKGLCGGFGGYAVAHGPTVARDRGKVKVAVEFSEHFRAMNTDVDIVIGASEAPIAAFVETRLLFEQQEGRFSRFRGETLLSRLNRGETVDDPWLDTALELAIEAHAQTRGLFNPMVLQALVLAGYDRSFDLVAGGAPAGIEVPSPGGCLEHVADGWRLKAGAVDLGGIVKGWTADLAAEHLLARYRDVFLNAGGDIRCAGAEDRAPGWKVEVDAPGGGVAWAGTVEGAIATSSTLKRRWRTDTGAMAHHLIDPRTGLPARTPFVQVTVRAESCTWAEVWAKAVLIGGDEGLAIAEEYGLAVLALGPGGERAASRAW